MNKPKETFMPIYFVWNTTEPDGVKFKPASPTFTPTWFTNIIQPVVVVIYLPIKHELVDNTDDVLKAHLSGGDVPDPILTIAGLTYCEQMFVNRNQIIEEPTENNPTEKDTFDTDLSWD